MSEPLPQAKGDQEDIKRTIIDNANRQNTDSSTTKLDLVENCDELDKQDVVLDHPSSTSSTSSSTSGPSGSSFDYNLKSVTIYPIDNDSTIQTTMIETPSSISHVSDDKSIGVEEFIVSDSLASIHLDSERDSDCYNQVLDEEIRNRLDKLNALSDLINSLELQFDQANILFRETLKCSTERLSTIAKNLGPKSIKRGRVYHEAKISVEQTQTECQRACVEFEQANNDHQYAKQAIREAESKLFEITCSNSQKTSNHKSPTNSNEHAEPIESNLANKSDLYFLDDYKTASDNNATNSKVTYEMEDSTINSEKLPMDRQQFAQNKPDIIDEDAIRIFNSAKLSEDLNKAIVRLVEAEEKRLKCEKLHLDQANKLMVAQENLTKLEREHGTTIKKAQIYFDEAKQFNAKLNSVKSDIAKVSESIVAAKRAYARTLGELEQFSEELHISAKKLIDSRSEMNQSSNS